MFIRLLELENIRSYIKETIFFKEGSTLLSGDVGSGKSSILLAIEFALFGLLRSMLDGKVLLRHGSTEGSVLLKFSLDGNEFTIKRTLKRTKKGQVIADTPFFLQNNEELTYTKEELRSKILSLLGYPQELVKQSRGLLYRYTVYIPQEEMQQILAARELRIEIIRKLFQLDKYKKISENATIILGMLRERQRLLNGNIQLLAPVEVQLKGLNNSLLSTQQELTATRTKQQIIQISVEQKKEQLSELKKIWENNNAVQRTLDTLAIQQKETNHRLQEKMGVMQKLSESANNKERVAESKLRQQQIKEKQQRLLNLVQSLQQSKYLLEDTMKEKEQKQTEQEKFVAQEISIRALHSAAQQELTTLMKQYELLNGLNVCPQCKQEIRQEHKQKLLKKQQQEMDEVTARQEAMMKKKEYLQIQKTQIAVALQILNEKEKQHAVVEQVLQEYVGMGGAAEMRWEEAENKGTLLMKEKEIGEAIEKINALNKERHMQMERQQQRNEEQQQIIVLQEQISALNMQEKHITERIEQEKTHYKILDIKDFVEKEKLLSEEEKQQKEVNRVLAQLTERIAQLEHQRRDAKEKIQQMTKMKKEIGEINLLHHWIEQFFTKMVAKIEKQHMHTVHSSFTKDFSSWFGLFVEENLTATLDDSFSPLIQQNGHDTTMAHLSGGEKTSCAFAYRLALNKIINEVIQTIRTRNLLILDEPTDGFSSEQLGIMREVFKTIQLRQIILVSHEEKVEGFVDNVIKIQKEQHISRVA